MGQRLGGVSASVPPQGPRLEVPVTGNVIADLAGDLINDTLSPFSNFPLDDIGIADVADLVTGVMGILGLAETALDYGVSLLLAPFAQMMSLPAARLTDLHVGLPHGHAHPPSLIPPLPVPIPLPSLGMVAMSGAINVLIGGIPAARAGDIGIAPVCFSFAPVFMIVTGSSSVYIGGSRAARMGDLTIHCNPILAAVVKMQAAGAAMAMGAAAAGFVSSAARGQMQAAVVNAAQAGLDVARDALKMTIGRDPALPPLTPCVMGMVLSGSPNVKIGGLPVPPADILMGFLKGEVGGQDRPRNRHANDADADAERSRSNEAGACKC